MDSREYARYKQIGEIIELLDVPKLSQRQTISLLNKLRNYVESYDYTYSKVRDIAAILKEKGEMTADELAPEIGVSLETTRQIARAVNEGGGPITINPTRTDKGRKGKNYYSYDGKI